VPELIDVRLREYAAGFADGVVQARLGKPTYRSASDYGTGFADGWRSIRYGKHPAASAGARTSSAPIIRAPRALSLVAPPSGSSGSSELSESEGTAPRSG
jgi:hypothetical protein